MTTAPPKNPLLSVPLFAGLDSELLDILLASCWVRRYPQGQILVSQGDQCEEFKILERGRVRISRFGMDGREVVLAMRSAPTVFGELTLFDGARCSATLIADTEVELRIFDINHMRSTIAGHPEAAMAMLRTMAGIMRATNERLADVMSLDVPGRLAKWLLDQGAETGTVSMSQSQEALALSLGATRVTVNRALRRFDRLGLISMHGRSLTILDPVSLCEITVP